MATNLREIYQLKIQLMGIRPPIWRRFHVLDSTSLDEFHIICQIVMGWTNSHLHQFIKDKTRYGIIDPDFDMGWDGELENEDEYTLKDLLSHERDQLIYEYDFGDGWEHKITLEKVLPFSVDQNLPVCIKGVRGCPPEDVGGTWGYEEFLEAWLNESHPEHKEMKEWAGDYFHPEDYELEETNQCLIDVLKSA